MDQKMFKKLNIKEFMKDTSGPRLQSLRLPRDLNLGGNKVTKKVYKPNVNVVRNKNKTGNASRKVDKPKQHEQDRLQDRKARFVQSSGVFSEGIGINVQTNIGQSQTKIHNRNTEKVNVPPSITKKKSEEFNRTREDKILNNMLKDDMDECDVDEKTPFSPISWTLSKESIKTEYEKQNFPFEYTDMPCSEQQPILTLWQLPDSLSFGNTGNSKTKKVVDYTLTTLPDGKIGRICIHKSGKISINLRDTCCDLEKCGESFYEEVVSLDCISKSAFVLGNIQSRFILNPDWKSLVAK